MINDAYTCLYSKCFISFYLWFIILNVSFLVGQAHKYYKIKKNSELIGIINGVEIYHNVTENIHSSEFFGLFKYVVLNKNHVIYKFTIKHELTHIKYYHPTITCLIILSGYIFENWFISCLLSFTLRKISSYIYEMYADYNAIKELKYGEIINVSIFFKSLGNLNLIDCIIDQHPSSKFRANYICNMAKSIKSNNINKYDKYDTFYKFFIYSHIDYMKF